MGTRTPSPPPYEVPHNTPGAWNTTSPNGIPNSSVTKSPQPTLSSILNILLPTAVLTYPPPHARYTHLTPIIASLSVYPSLEAALHLSNGDLPSTHFLVRHMNGPPAIEGMLLHSILHRSEGDFSNARAWLSDVRDACEGWMPKQRGKRRLEPDIVKCGTGSGKFKGSLLDVVYEDDSAEQMIDDVENIRRIGGVTSVDMEARMGERIRWELERIIEWCRSKFGDGKWVDASSAWVRPGEQVRKLGNDMVSGNKGWRKF